jgi:hypothetical protein
VQDEDVAAEEVNKPTLSLSGLQNGVEELLNQFYGRKSELKVQVLGIRGRLAFLYFSGCDMLATLTMARVPAICSSLRHEMTHK